MFDHNHYIPILKGKEGEFSSLDELEVGLFDKFTPLIEVSPVPYDFEKDQPKYSIEEHIDGLSERLDKCIKGEYVYIDFNLIEANEKLDNGSEPISKLFDEIRELGSNAIPVTSLSRDKSYQVAVKQIVIDDANGLCLRLTQEELSSDDFVDNLENLISSFELQYSDIDLIIDFQDISKTSPSSTLLLLKTLINSVIPNLQNWRSFTISSSSFPETMSEIDRKSVEYLERNEIEIYKSLLESNIKRKPTFSDYSIASPHIVNVDPRIMNMSASIRYTTNESWLILKGSGVRTPGSGGFKQFHKLSQAMLKLPDYDGKGYSWGDEFIYECANMVSGTGNATTWRKVGNTHHITKMLDVIASLP